MTTASKVHPVSRSADPTPALGPTSPAWQDPATVWQIAHRQVHTRPQPDCNLCPPTACPCGVTGCPDAFDHRRTHAGAEATVLELSA